MTAIRILAICAVLDGSVVLSDMAKAGTTAPRSSTDGDRLKAVSPLNKLQAYAPHSNSLVSLLTGTPFKSQSHLRRYRSNEADGARALSPSSGHAEYGISSPELSSACSNMCGQYIVSAACWCDRGCSRFQDCCPNTSTVCTLAPTSSPVPLPTSAPTMSPTTTEPTSIPTNEPSQAPSAFPTSEPTEEPTAIPTTGPTLSPTVTPTPLPTHEPTYIPTVGPTTNPTIGPTRLPSMAPTYFPTGLPSTDAQDYDSVIAEVFETAHLTCASIASRPEMCDSPLTAFICAISCRSGFTASDYLRDQSNVLEASYGYSCNDPIIGPDTCAHGSVSLICPQTCATRNCAYCVDLAVSRGGCPALLNETYHAVQSVPYLPPSCSRTCTSNAVQRCRELSAAPTPSPSMSPTYPICHGLCGSYSLSGNCWCTSDCSRFSDCCDDVEYTCSSAPSSAPTFSPTISPTIDRCPGGQQDGLDCAHVSPQSCENASTRLNCPVMCDACDICIGHRCRNGGNCVSASSEFDDPDIDSSGQGSQEVSLAAQLYGYHCECAPGYYGDFCEDGPAECYGIPDSTSCEPLRRSMVLHGVDVCTAHSELLLELCPAMCGVCDPCLNETICPVDRRCVRTDIDARGHISIVQNQHLQYQCMCPYGLAGSSCTELPSCNGITDSANCVTWAANASDLESACERPVIHRSENESTTAYTTVQDLCPTMCGTCDPCIGSCLNGASCLRVESNPGILDHQCICREGFSGDTCEVSASPTSSPSVQPTMGPTASPSNLPTFSPSIPAPRTCHGVPDAQFCGSISLRTPQEIAHLCTIGAASACPALCNNCNACTYNDCGDSSTCRIRNNATYECECPFGFAGPPLCNSLPSCFGDPDAAFCQSMASSLGQQACSLAGVGVSCAATCGRCDICATFPCGVNETCLNTGRDRTGAYTFECTSHHPTAVPTSQPSSSPSQSPTESPTQETCHGLPDPEFCSQVYSVPGGLGCALFADACPVECNTCTDFPTVVPTSAPSAPTSSPTHSPTMSPTVPPTPLLCHGSPDASFCNVALALNELSCTELGSSCPIVCGLCNDDPCLGNRWRCRNGGLCVPADDSPNGLGSSVEAVESDGGSGSGSASFDDDLAFECICPRTHTGQFCEIATESPTSMPTSAPSMLPTSMPSSVPTSEPTTEPSLHPTSIPTSGPTTEPTFEPTLAPTFEPTSGPTSGPTQEPTEEPTHTPSTNPTLEPTMVPSPSPTLQPSMTPTQAPSDVPSAVPSTAPSSPPTFLPSLQPTYLPTAAPTVQPSLVPTATPTFQPTSPPSASPTAYPSIVPTFAPTALPSASPSAIPSESPTLMPTLLPTNAPTSEPTAIIPSISGSNNGPSTGSSALSDRKLPIVTLIGGTAAILCLLIMVFLFAYFQTARKAPKIAQMHFAAMTIVAVVIYMVMSRKGTSTAECRLEMTALHFCVLASFCWLLTDATYLYETFEDIFNRQDRHTFETAIESHRVLFSYGVAAIIAAICAATLYSPTYQSDNYENICTYDSTSVRFAFFIPGGLGITAIVYTLFHTFLYNRRNDQHAPHSPDGQLSLIEKKHSHAKSTLVATFFSSLTFAAGWTCAILALYEKKDTTAWISYNTFFAACLAISCVVIFIYKCLLDADLHTALARCVGAVGQENIESRTSKLGWAEPEFSGQNFHIEENWPSSDPVTPSSPSPSAVSGAPYSMHWDTIDDDHHTFGLRTESVARDDGIEDGAVDMPVNLPGVISDIAFTDHTDLDEALAVSANQSATTSGASEVDEFSTLDADTPTRARRLSSSLDSAIHILQPVSKSSRTHISPPRVQEPVLDEEILMNQHTDLDVDEDDVDSRSYGRNSVVSEDFVILPGGSRPVSALSNTPRSRQVNISRSNDGVTHI